MSEDYLVEDYDTALARILRYGEKKVNARTGIAAYWLPGLVSTYDLSGDRLPAISRRKLNYVAVVGELAWFLRGWTRNSQLVSLGCNYWTPWVDKKWAEARHFLEDAFGPVYGFQLRHFGGDYTDGDSTSPDYGFDGFDQLKRMLRVIHDDPSSRQNMWSLWDPRTLQDQRLPPCHVTYQVLINPVTQKLTGLMTQRSCDFPVGVPANIMFYSLLTIMLARLTGYTPYKFVHFTADSHIYENQVDGVREYFQTDIVPSPKYDLTWQTAAKLGGGRSSGYQVARLERFSSAEVTITPAVEAPNIRFPVAV